MAGSGLPDLDVQRVCRWCAQRVPEHVRDQVRVECDAGQHEIAVAQVAAVDVTKAPGVVCTRVPREGGCPGRAGAAGS